MSTFTLSLFYCIDLNVILSFDQYGDYEVHSVYVPTDPNKTDIKELLDTYYLKEGSKRTQLERVADMAFNQMQDEYPEEFRAIRKRQYEFNG